MKEEQDGPGCTVMFFIALGIFCVIAWVGQATKRLDDLESKVRKLELKP